MDSVGEGEAQNKLHQQSVSAYPVKWTSHSTVAPLNQSWAQGKYVRDEKTHWLKCCKNIWQFHKTIQCVSHEDRLRVTAPEKRAIVFLAYFTQQNNNNIDPAMHVAFKV